MSGNTSHDEQRMAPDVKAGIVKRAVQVFFLIAFQAAMLFLSSGRLDWLWAWVYVGFYLAAALINATFMLRYSPETIARRAEATGMKDWDKVVGGLFGVMYFVIILLISGLDVRFGWTLRAGTQIALALQIAAVVAFAAGYALFSWGMISNAHFATVVRVQGDRGHAVCNTGPYRFVRHPGYIGGMIQSLALPLMLGSLWAFIPGGLAALLLVIRTALEDKTLLKELDGYEEYAQQVRYRLLPGVW
jgi:protein-S-isoprenylcysteine O-methyltransferase Ste14